MEPLFSLILQALTIKGTEAELDLTILSATHVAKTTAKFPGEESFKFASSALQ